MSQPHWEESMTTQNCCCKLVNVYIFGDLSQKISKFLPIAAAIKMLWRPESKIFRNTCVLRQDLTLPTSFKIIASNLVCRIIIVVGFDPKTNFLNDPSYLTWCEPFRQPDIKYLADISSSSSMQLITSLAKFEIIISLTGIPGDFKRF